MKTIHNLSILLLCAALTMGGCSTLKEFATPENARGAAALLCSNALALAVSDQDRTETANWIYSVAYAVRTLSGGKVPTPRELEDAIRVFTPSGSKWVNLATSLSGIWRVFYPRVSGNPAEALKYLEAIAAGAEDAAAGYLPAPSPR